MNNNQEQRYHVSELLKQHEEFIVIGLTGRVGSGCSEVANILSSNFEEIGLPHIYPGNIGLLNDSERDKRILYRYASHHWLAFDVIRVRSIITSFLLEDFGIFCEDIAKLLQLDEKEDMIIRDLLSMIDEAVEEWTTYADENGKERIYNLFKDCYKYVPLLEGEDKTEGKVEEQFEAIINSFESEVQKWVEESDIQLTIEELEKLFKTLYEKAGNEKKYTQRNGLLQKTDGLLNAFSARAAAKWWKEQAKQSIIEESEGKGRETVTNKLKKLFEATEWDKTDALDFSKYIIVHDIIPFLSDIIHDFISKKKGSLFTELYQKYGNCIRRNGRINRGEIIVAPSISNSVFAIPRRINQFIKTLRHPFSRTFAKPTRIVIDSLKSVLEADYLRNRYSAFYLFSISAEESVRAERLLNKKNLTVIEKTCIDWNEYSTQGAGIYSRFLKVVNEITDNNPAAERHSVIEKAFEKIEKDKDFGDAEIVFLKKVESYGSSSQVVFDPVRKDAYEKNLYRFLLQDIGASIQNADVFISNNHRGKSKNLELRWEIVRNICLIAHPGLLLPTPIERCMQVAFTAKANSGCLSRQVGAVVTDVDYNILSIGWNDVPCGDISCSRKNLIDILNERDIQAYSDYELYNKDFRERIKHIYENGCENSPEPVARVLGGLPWRYCFKDVHVDVHVEGKQPMRSRAMHAEEKALSSVQDKAEGG